MSKAAVSCLPQGEPISARLSAAAERLAARKRRSWGDVGFSAISVIETIYKEACEDPHAAEAFDKKSVFFHGNTHAGKEVSITFPDGPITRIRLVQSRPGSITMKMMDGPSVRSLQVDQQVIDRGTLAVQARQAHDFVADLIVERLALKRPLSSFLAQYVGWPREGPYRVLHGARC